MGKHWTMNIALKLKCSRPKSSTMCDILATQFFAIPHFTFTSYGACVFVRRYFCKKYYDLKIQ